ncbi:TIM barrel protein [Candidatus Poribacteria bacterium]|nr:TIM barrel protein [Candidatus Poribacteria bacterium]
MAIRLGGPVFIKSEDPVELARAHLKLGYRAAYCPHVELKDQQKIRQIEKAFKEADVAIAEVGIWINLMDPDEEKRKNNLDKVCDRLALADEVGALCCVDIAGSFNPEAWDGPHPDNLTQKGIDLTVENVRYILDSVKPKRAKFALEMMPWAVPDSPDSFLELIELVERPGFAVHLDPVNLINSPRRYYENIRLLEECFDKLGQWIISCHAKDSQLTNQLTTHINEARPGTGILDYHTYLRKLEDLQQDAPLMLEHLSSSEEYDLARQYVFSVGKEMDISF